MTDSLEPAPPSPPKRRRRHVGARSAPAQFLPVEILPPEAALAEAPADAAADRAPLVAADADDRLPPDLEFTPVPRREARSNGLTPKRQRLFIKYLAASGSVHTACRVIGCSDHAVYHLRQAPGAESFATAWERAVERGARRVRDVLLDQSINGIPERIYKDGQLIAERRVFNTRAQMWIAAHDMPERFGVTGGLMHANGAPLNLKRLKEAWRKEWEAEHQAKTREWDARASQRYHHDMTALRRHFKATLADDPAKRAAWNLLAGPTDWSDFDNLPDYGRSPSTPDTNQTRPDMILTMAAPLGEDGESVGDVVFGGNGAGEDG